MKEKTIKIIGENVQISDGYHTFDELYDHRITLWIALCKFLQQSDGLVWRSKLHSDGTGFEGWFILGYRAQFGKQISYHLPMDRWNETEFATTQELAPEWDNHTPSDVIERLKNL